MKLYQRIKERREELGLSQDDLAQRMGYRSRSTIAKIESGKNDIPQSKIVAFAKALNTSPEYLMGFDNQADFAELDIFKETLSLLGWSYETLYNCDGLYANKYLNDEDKMICDGSASYEKCYHCIHNQPYYYLTNGHSYYKLNKEEFDRLSTCISPYLNFRITELISGKKAFSEYEYKVEECLIHDCQLNAANQRLDATDIDKIQTDKIMTNDTEWE